MYIENLNLKNFGKLCDREIRLEPGINIIYGKNEAGKSTVFSFIRGMLFGIDKLRGRASKNDLYTQLEPWDNPLVFEGSCRMVKGGVHYFMERRFYRGDKYLRIVNEDTKTELSGTEAENFFEDLSEIRYLNTVSVSQTGNEGEAGLAKEIQNCVANLNMANSSSLDLQGAYQCLKDNKRRLEKKLYGNAEAELRGIEAELSVTEREKELNAEKRKAAGDNILKLERKRSDIETRQKRKLQKRRTLLFAGLCLFIAAAGLSVWAAFTGRYMAFGIAAEICGLCCILLLAVSVFGIKGNARNAFLEREKQYKAFQTEMTRADLLLEQSHEKEARLLERKDELLKCIEANAGIEKEIAAIELALSTMEQISIRLREEFAGKLNMRISELVEIFTDGAYSDIRLDKDGAVYVWDKKRLIPLERLSKGTMEQIRLAVRLTVADEVFGMEGIPIVLDEAFAFYDAERLKRVLASLVRLDRQVILFTCHEREAELLKELGAVFNQVCL